jgi:hypothetical protein
MRWDGEDELDLANIGGEANTATHGKQTPVGHTEGTRAILTWPKCNNPCIRGWIDYYSHFYKTQLRPTLKRIDLYVIRPLSVQSRNFRGARGKGRDAPITAIRPVRLGALLDPRRMGAAVV